MKGKTRKKLSGVTAVCCAAAILATGTFAWQAASAAFNEFSGNKKQEPPVVTDPGANLYDDFDASTGDKKIFVENTGDTNVFVRLKLEEFMNVGSTNKGTPNHLHIPVSTAAKQDPADCEGQNDTNDFYHDGESGYFNWTMGNKQDYTYKSITGTSEWTNAGTRNEKDILVGDNLGSTQPIGDVKVINTQASSVKKTAKACEVITMAQYNQRTDADKASFKGWVYDTDGFAYWSQPLAKGEATGLLLEKVSLPAEGSMDYYYAINATLEYVDQKDIGAWLEDGDDGNRTYQTTGKGQINKATEKGPKGGEIKEGSNAGGTTTEASEDASKLLENISELPATGVSTNPTKLNMLVGDERTVVATMTPENSTDKLTWTSSDDKIATVDQNGKVTAKAPGTATITVTTTSGKKATTAVTVGTGEVPATALNLDKTHISVDNKKPLVSETVKASLAPSDTTESITADNLKWTTSTGAEDIATIVDNKDGTVTITAMELKKGEFTLTATYTTAKGEKLTKDCAVSIGQAKLDLPNESNDRWQPDKYPDIDNDTDLRGEGTYLRRTCVLHADNDVVTGYYFVPYDDQTYWITPKGNQQRIKGGEQVDYSYAKTDLAFYLSEDGDGKGVDLNDYTFEIMENDQYGDVFIKDNAVWGKHLWTRAEVIADYDACHATAKIRITKISTGEVGIATFNYRAYGIFVAN